MTPQVNDGRRLYDAEQMTPQANDVSANDARSANDTAGK